MDFKGVSQGSCEVYIIDDKVHDEDLESGYPLSGPRGDLVWSLLGSMSLLDKVRVGNWEGHGPDIVKEDIIKSNPKVVIGLGSKLMNLFVDTQRKVTEMSGTITDVDINGVRFKYLILMSPSYIINRMEDSDLVLRFSQDLYKSFQLINGEYKDILKDKEILSAHSFEEFKEIYESRFVNDSKISYDIETNARPIYMDGSRIIGFSIGNKKSGVYVSISALDFEMSEEEEDKIWDYTINEVFEKKDKLIIHNTMYERPYTLYCKNYEIGFDKAEDTLVMARLLKGAKEGAGLKYQAQKNLQYPDWETDLTTYISGFRDVVGRIAFGPKKFQGVWSEIFDNKVGVFDITDTESFSSLSEDDQVEIISIIDKLKSPLIDLYSKEEISELGGLLSEKFILVYNQGGIVDSTIPYNYIPDRVLSKYGAVDSISTYDLYDYFNEMMDRDSTGKVDLHKGYQNWLEHMYVAYIMERNGLYWNEDLVKEDEEFLTNQATNCLKSMLKSPVFKPFVLSACGWKYKPLILSDYLPQIAESQGYSVEYSVDTGKYVIKYCGKRVAKGCLDNIIILDNFKSQYEEIVYQMFNEDVEKASHYEELKDIYNPSSPTQSDIPRKILINDTLQMGGRVVQLHTLSVSPEFENIIDSLPVVDQKFLKVSRLLCEVGDLKSMYGDEWASKRKEIFEGFTVMYNSIRNRVQSPEIRSILDNSYPVSIESFDDGGIIEVYNNLVVTGIDQDDRSTWTPQFEWMINFRLFKKSAKIISSYIEGSVGRQSVVVVDKDKVKRGDHCVPRKRYYTPTISPDEDYLMAAKWSPNTAETGRWRSAQHTIPWGSQVKKYYTSRFKGGTCLAPDYCLTGDTKIKLLDGRVETLENLYNSGETEFEVYSYDFETHRVVPGKAKYLSITRNESEIYEIVLDNGCSIKCTHNHKLITVDGQKVKAEDLQVGTSLQPCNFRVSDDRILKGYEELDHGKGNWEFTHHIVSDFVNGKPQSKSQIYRHHINGNKYDNRTSNLKLISAADHMSHHIKEYHRTHEEEFSQLMKETHSTPEYIKSASERTTRQWESNSEYRDLMHGVCTTKCAESLRKSNTDEKCIELRKQGRDEVVKKLVEETFAKVVLSGIIVSEYTWDEIIDYLGLLVKGCTGNSRKNIVRVFGDFLNFIETLKSLLPPQYYDEVVFRTKFENKVGRVRSKTYKIYFNNFETLGYFVSENTWDDCIELLKSARSANFTKVYDKYHLPRLKKLEELGSSFDELKRYSRLNHRVVEIKIHHLETPVPVYDMQVDVFHNFFICAGENSAVLSSNSQMEVRTLAAISKDENMLNLFYSGRDFHSETAAQVWQKPVEEVTTAERRFSKTATFSLLYGAMEESFAKNYCNGDLAMAQKIYGGFFRAYPRVKEWVDERHAEVQRDHRVSLELSGRFIPILPEGDGKGALNSMLRKSQNYPIQAQSADLTGCVIFDLQQYIEENNMKSLVIMYVHDSIEVDVYPYELIQLVDKLKILLNESPMRRMGLPSKADVTLGKSLGHEIEMESIEYNEDFTEGVISLKGYQDEIYETIDNWKNAYKTVEIFDEDWKEEFVSMSELFILRKAYTPTLGTLRHKGTCKVRIKYYS